MRWETLRPKDGLALLLALVSLLVGLDAFFNPGTSGGTFLTPYRGPIWLFVALVSLYRADRPAWTGK